jgi:hypothetical protein
MVEYLKRLNEFREMNAALTDSRPKTAPSAMTISSSTSSSSRPLAASDRDENSQNCTNKIPSPSSDRGNGKSIEQRATVVRKVGLDRLVWAPCHNIKGNSSDPKMVLCLVCLWFRWTFLCLCENL